MCAVRRRRLANTMSMNISSKALSISVVIPAYNEVDGIAEVISGIQHCLQAAGFQAGADCEVLVVDDGSQDQTAAVAQKAGARVVRHPCNLGYGKALRTGFEQAHYDWVATIDGDGSYPPSELAKLLPFVPDYEMVVGARQGDLFWGGLLRSALRCVQLALAKFVAGVEIPDPNSGLRLVRKTAEQLHMPIRCYGYSFSTTITLSFIQEALPVKFVPVAFQERVGRSKIHPLRDILRMLQLMLEIIIYFNPIKFCVVLSLAPWGLGALLALRYVFTLRSADLAGFLFCGATAIFIFLCGCILDSIRLHSPRKP